MFPLVKSSSDSNVAIDRKLPQVSTTTALQTPAAKPTFQYMEIHQIVQEPASFQGLELETPSTKGTKEILCRSAACGPSPGLKKNTETWISKPIKAGRQLTVMATARRLTFSNCSDLPAADATEENDSDYSSSSIYTDGDLCIELNQRNTELERQNNKLLADQRETTSQLNYKDDKIQFLERRNDALEQQLRSITLAMDLKIDDYRQVIQLQAEELEKTKDVLKTKTNRLSVVEKELVALKKQNEDAAAEFDKAYAEATWNQNALLAAKREHQKKEQAAKRQRKLDAERIAQLEHENRQLHSDLEGISDYCTKLEQEKTDLQDELAQSTVNDNATHSLLHQLEVDDCEGDQTLDTETLLTNAFRPVESEMSLFSELQSCLGSQFTPVAEVSTQTEELTPQVFHTWESPICSKIEVEEAPQKLQLSTKATQTQAEITAYTKATQTQDEITANCSPVLPNGECSVPVPKKQYTSPSVRDGKQLNRVSSPPLDIRRRRPSIPNSKPVTSADSRKHLILQYGDWILSGACWPWDGTTTWNGLMRGLTIILMLLGFLIATKVISVPSCGLSVRTLFGLSHKTPPRI